MNIKTLPLITFTTLLSATHIAYPAEDQGAFTPETMLADGVDSSISTNPYTNESGPARKGTIAATLNNIALLNKKLPKASSKEDIKDITNVIDNLIPSLRVVGMFDLFTVEQWMETADQPGRVWVVLLYLKKYPQELTASRREKLEHIAQSTPVKILSDEIHAMLGTVNTK